MLSEARNHLRGTDFRLHLIPQMESLPAADRSLVQSPAAGCPLASRGFNLRVNGHGSHRLNRTREAQILAEAQHRLHAGIGLRIKIHARQQLAAVGRRLFHSCGEALAALAKCPFLPGRHEPSPQPGRAARSVGDDHQRSVLKPAKKRAVGGRAQGPRPVVFLRIAGPRLSRKPLNHFVKGVERQVDNRMGANVNVLAHRGQEGCAHRLDRITAGEHRWNRELAAAVGVDAGNHRQIGAQQLHYRAYLRHSAGVPHQARNRSWGSSVRRNAPQCNQGCEEYELEPAHFHHS